MISSKSPHPWPLSDLTPTLSLRRGSKRRGEKRDVLREVYI